jgi:hypothetical protein
MQKGTTNNPNGRPAGTANKLTSLLKEKIELIIENNIDLFQKDLEALEPKDRLNLVVKLFDFVLPKQKEMKLETEFREQPIFATIKTYEGLPDFYFDEEGNKINPSDYEND